jgi:hypothetical protein
MGATARRRGGRAMVDAADMARIVPAQLAGRCQKAIREDSLKFMNKCKKRSKSCYCLDSYFLTAYIAA